MEGKVVRASAQRGGRPEESQIHKTPFFRVSLELLGMLMLYLLCEVLLYLILF